MRARSAGSLRVERIHGAPGAPAADASPKNIVVTSTALQRRPHTCPSDRAAPTCTAGQTMGAPVPGHRQPMSGTVVRLSTVAGYASRSARADHRARSLRSLAPSPRPTVGPTMVETGPVASLGRPLAMAPPQPSPVAALSSPLSALARVRPLRISRPRERSPAGPVDGPRQHNRPTDRLRTTTTGPARALEARQGPNRPMGAARLDRDHQGPTSAMATARSATARRLNRPTIASRRNRSRHRPTGPARGRGGTGASIGPARHGNGTHPVSRSRQGARALLSSKPPNDRRPRR